MIPTKTPGGRKLRQRAIAATRETLPAPSTIVANILDQYERTGSEDRAAGSRWYCQANTVAKSLASWSEIPVPGACGVIAALSPQQPWDVNVTNAYDLCAGNLNVHTQDAVIKAQQCQEGQDPRTVLRGRKVRSFYSLLLNPERYGPVVIDRHTLLIAWPECPSEKILERVGAYQMVAAAYRTAARQLHLAPHHLQAMTWLSHRREHAQGWFARDPF